MTDGSDDRLTAATHLAAILSIDLRPGGKLEGTIRDASHYYRFSGLKALPAAVLRWLAEEIGRPVDGGLDPVHPDIHGPSAPRGEKEQPCP